MSDLRIPTFYCESFPIYLQEFLENNAIICDPRVLTNPQAKLSMEARLIVLGGLNEVFLVLLHSWSGFEIEYIYEWRRDRIKEKLYDAETLKTMFSKHDIFNLECDEDEIRDAVIGYLEETERKFIYQTLKSHFKDIELIRLFCLEQAQDEARDDEEEFEKKREYSDDDDEYIEFDMDKAIDRNVRRYENYSVSQWISNSFILDF